MPDTSWRTWLDALSLSRRRPPEFFQKEDMLVEASHPGELRVAFDQGLDAVFCVNGVPTIGLVNADHFKPSLIRRLHEVLWNQGVMAMLLVICGNEMKAFSLTQRISPLDSEVGTGNDPRLVRHFSLLSDALEMRNLILQTESGRLFVEYPDQFKKDQRVDKVLLDNLGDSLKKLTKDLSMASAQALLMRAMLVAYLEDREILTPDYFLDVSSGQASSWQELLALGIKHGGIEPITPLFQKLDKDFNGSVFLDGGGFNDSEDIPLRLKARHFELLRDLLRGKLNMKSRQYRLIHYDFRYIPVALISSIYNMFLDAEPGKKRTSGAYYTPLHLVDMAVDQAWRKLSDPQRMSGDILDPSCGSGVFLVRLFERVVEYRRSSGEVLKWDDLVSTAQRFHGVDINPTAIRLTAVSLYIALLEQLEPRDIRQLMERSQFLPRLIDDGCLVEGSYFLQHAEKKYVLIIGNPPWSSRRKDDTKALEWAKERKYPTPGEELAWAFVWKCGEQLAENGLCALMLPAMGLLHNTKSANARKMFIQKYAVHRVINLSDIRFVLFDGAKRPTVLVLFAGSNNEKKYSFEYWTPKADLFSTRKRSLTLSHADRIQLTSAQVQKDPVLFVRRLWLRSRGEKLLSYLRTYEPLSSFIDDYGSLNRKKSESRFGWIIGQGFNQANDKRFKDETYINKLVVEDKVMRYPFLAAKDLKPLAINRVKLSRAKSNIVYRRNFTRGFVGPHVLFMWLSP